MGGKGYYDDHSGPQRAGFAEQQARVSNAVKHLDLAVPELRILDYGCGPGRTSIAVIRTALEELSRRDNTLRFVAMHNDQAGNDWNGLVASIAGPDGYLDCAPHIRIEASIGSFFQPVASPGSVDLGLSFGASHWLASQVQVASPGTLFFCDLPQPGRDEMAAMAKRDWTTFLRQRAGELKSGAWLVVDSLGSVADDDDPSGRRAAGRRLYRGLGEIAQEFADDGRIDPQLMEEFVFPVYFRLSEEMRAPVELEADLADAFEIIEVANELLPMPTEAALAKTGDVAAYASSYAGFVRAFAESTLRTALFEGSTADAAEADALADAFFDRLQALFAAEPDRHGFEHQVATLVLRRR